MPLEHIQYAMDVWRKQFYDRLVGFRHQGRAHSIGGDGLLRYSTNQTHGISMVLPSGFVYDRRFLNIYTHNMGNLGLLTYVDSITNCDDILFNFVTANETSAGPVVVNYFARVLDMGSKGGLWTRGVHMSARDECVRHFAKIFKGVPLLFFGLRGGISKGQELSRSGGLHDVPMADDVWWTREPLRAKISQ